MHLDINKLTKYWFLKAITTYHFFTETVMTTVIINYMYLLVESGGKQLSFRSEPKMWFSYTCNGAVVVCDNFYTFS